MDERNAPQISTVTAVDALRRGIDLGLAHIDTAEMYGSGRAEQVIAKAIDGRREEIFLVSKVLPSNASRKGVVKACEATLARLKTDRLDCYLLHRRGSYPSAFIADDLGILCEYNRGGSWWPHINYRWRLRYCLIASFFCLRD